MSFVPIDMLSSKTLFSIDLLFSISVIIFIIINRHHYSAHFSLHYSLSLLSAPSTYLPFSISVTLFYIDIFTLLNFSNTHLHRYYLLSSISVTLFSSILFTLLNFSDTPLHRYIYCSQFLWHSSPSIYLLFSISVALFSIDIFTLLN